MGRRRIEMFQYRQVLVRLRQGDSERVIARSRLMGRPKAACFRALAARMGWLDPQAPLPSDGEIAAALGNARRARSTISSAEAHRALVERWDAEGISGVVIHAALCREHGYSGSYSSIYRLLASIRARRLPEATVPLHFAPSEAAQVDFGAGPMLEDGRGGRRRTWAFVMTLCFSRHQYVEFVFDQSVATWLGCHRRAFEWFAAVPARVIIDNPKCAITRACSRDPIVQRAYAECAEGYGFKIDPCPPADPKKKGIVEAGVKYVKRNFLPLRSFRDLTDLNEQARRWVLDEAGARLHGTTREPPLERFARERPLMRPLPAVAPDLGVWARAKVHRDCHLQFEKSLYSVPFTLIGERLWLRATDTSVSVFEDHQLIAQHLRAREAGTRRTVREHLPPEAQAFFLRDRHWCVAQAERVGPACAELVDTLLADRIVERLRAAQGVIHLAATHGETRLELACRRALAHGSPHYRTVKTLLLSTRRNLLEELSSPVIEAHGPYLRGARFARTSRTLFHPDEQSIRLPLPTPEGD
jgi:transposase